MPPKTLSPEILERFPSAVAPSYSVAISQNCGIHRPCRGARNAIDLDGRLFQEAVQNTPGKRTMRAASLQRKIDEKGTVARNSPMH